MHDKNLKANAYSMVYAKSMMEDMGYGIRWWIHFMNQIWKKYFNLLQTKKMRLTYLWQTWYYKPEFDIQDFARKNNLEEYSPFTVVKLMKALYPLWINENRPEYDEVLDPNQHTNGN